MKLLCLYLICFIQHTFLGSHWWSSLYQHVSLCLSFTSIALTGHHTPYQSVKESEAFDVASYFILQMALIQIQLHTSGCTHLHIRSCIYASLCLRRREVDLWWALSGSTQLASKESVSISLSTSSVAPSCFTATKSLSQLFQWHLIGCICHAYICFSELAFPLQCFVFFLRKN